jgi:nuclear transport factor 2 (NTF2) superfamily protein
MIPKIVSARMATRIGNSMKNGLMRLRLACINDLPIKDSDRKYHWPLGRRPDDHPGLSDLGL